MTSTIASYSSVAMGSSSSTTVLDVNHPYYLHPSDNPGLVVSAVTLDENNYDQWQRSMEIALSSKLKLGFVDGSYVQPPANSPLYVHWMRCNNMITSWLLNSVNDTIRNSIVYMRTAKAIWDELQVRYAQSNVPKLFGLRKDISHLSQGSLSVTAYFTKFKTLLDELDCISAAPRCTCSGCTCGINNKLEASDKNVQMTQFLMGLNDQFTGIRGQILLMVPLPSLSQCYSMRCRRKIKGVLVPLHI